MVDFLANRVHVETSTSGTADLTLGAAISTAYQSFAGASVPNGATFPYTAYTSTQFECGHGAYISATPALDRTAANVVAGSAGVGALTNFSTNPRVFIGPLAEDFGGGGLTFPITGTGDTVTTSTLLLDLSQTWNAGGVTFTALKLNVTNTASAASSLLMDLQVGATSKFSVSRTGLMTVGVLNTDPAAIVIDPVNSDFSIYFGISKKFQFYTSTLNQLGISSDGTIGFSSSTNVSGNNDTTLFRDAAGILAQRNSTNAQGIRVYNTYTDASNYERAVFDWTTLPNNLIIGYQKAGTGSDRAVKLQARNNGDTNITLGINNTSFGDVNGQWVFQESGGNAYCFEIRTKGAGYGGTGLGFGGTVTQATSKSTGVTLSKLTGQITMNAAALAANTTVSFTLTNTNIEAADMLILNHISGGTGGAYTLNAQCAAGTASINVRNVTAGSLSEAIVIQFAILKGSTS